MWCQVWPRHGKQDDGMSITFPSAGEVPGWLQSGRQRRGIFPRNRPLDKPRTELALSFWRTAPEAVGEGIVVKGEPSIRNWRCLPDPDQQLAVSKAYVESVGDENHGSLRGPQWQTAEWAEGNKIIPESNEDYYIARLPSSTLNCVLMKPQPLWLPWRVKCT